MTGYAASPATNGQITFTSNRDGNHEIYFMNADGSNLANLTDNPANDLRPDWHTLPSTPRQAIEHLIEAVNALALNPGQGNTLIGRMQVAIQQLDRGQDETAINQLEAFVNQASAMISRSVLSAAEGQPLIEAANTIIAALGN